MSLRRRLLFLLTFGLGGATVLLWLGFWQLDRLEWKRGLIAEIEARASAPPLRATGAETPADERRPATATGRFAPGAPQIRYLTSLKGTGPGFRLIAPFALDSGARILVDRGFAPETAAPRGQPAPPPPEGPLALRGVLRWPNEISTFTPEPNLEQRLWFARDVDSMAAALETRPVLLVLSEPPAGAGAARWPQPALAVVDPPNNHLGYAVTWFAMAAIWLVMSALLGFRKRA